MRRVLALLLVMPTAAVAQDDSLPFDPMVIEQCLATGLADGCIGLAARACETTEGAMARGLCLGRETAWWEERAAQTRATLAAFEPDMAQRARQRDMAPQTLAAVDAAFAAYRDSLCGWRDLQWDGIHHAFEWAECRMRVTAAHAMLLEGWVDD